MRIRKTKKKTIDMRNGDMLSSDTAFAQSAKALAKAQEIAEYNRDVDAIVAIADRWNLLARTLESSEEEVQRIPLGFSVSSSEEEEHDHS
jgi:hypothetical protein